MPVRRTLIFFAIVFLLSPLGVIFAIVNAPARPEGSGNSRTPSYEYHVVGRGEAVSVVSAVGEIEADEVVDMSFIVPGRIAEVFVNPGDFLTKGTPLMRLENDDQRIGYDQAVLNLELREIERDDLLGPVDNDAVRIAQANVDAAWQSYRGASSTANSAQIAAADLQVQQAQAAFDAAAQRRQIGGDFDLQEEVNLADAKIGEASFNLEIAQLRADDLRSGDWSGANAAYLAYLRAERELERVMAGPSDIQIEQAEVRVDQAMAQLELAETSLLKTELTAPFDGYVADVYFEPGTLVNSTTSVIRMVDVDPLSLTVQIDEIDIGRIQPQMPVRVEIDAIPNLFLDATLEKIALTGVQTQGGIVNYDAEIQLNEVIPNVRVGMTAEANIIVAQADDVIVIPNAYIRLDRRNNAAYVNIVNEENEITEIPITLGLSGENFSEVTFGLNVGDIIAADLSGNQFSLFGG